MKHSFTSNSLVRFIYNEVSTSERLAIMEALRADAELRRAYEELKTAQNKLPKTRFNAPKSAISKILAHSKSTAVEPC
ncbi:MAG TPA: hypothetical protein VJ953_20145 [Saprospiraceae bacterium]|nr:hypothetical protein [Saprospiraceae bacterium]